MAVQAALNLCVCERETEAVIVKHQLVVQLLLKEVREDGGGGEEKSRVCKTEKTCPHTCTENN